MVDQKTDQSKYNDPDDQITDRTGRKILQQIVKYGLDKDSRITVDITYKDTDTKKTKNVVLYIGKKDSDQKNYYVQMKGSHMVYLSDKDVVKNILNP